MAAFIRCFSCGGSLLSNSYVLHTDSILVCCYCVGSNRGRERQALDIMRVEGGRLFLRLFLGAMEVRGKPREILSESVRCSDILTNQ